MSDSEATGKNDPARNIRSRSKIFFNTIALTAVSVFLVEWLLYSVLEDVFADSVMAGMVVNSLSIVFIFTISGIFLLRKLRNKNMPQSTFDTCLENHLNSIIDVCPDAITVADLEGNVLECNRAALDLLKIQNKNDYIGQNLYNYISEDLKNRLTGDIQRVQSSKKLISLDYELIQTDGTRIFVDVSASVLRDSNGNPYGFIATGRDITARKKAERDLNESEERFKKLISAAPVSILLVQDGRYVFGNHAGARMLGYDHPSQIIGLSALDTIAPECHQAIIERMKQVKSGSANKSMQLKIQRPDGAFIWSESTSVPIKIDGKDAALVIGRDMTEQRKAEQKIRESEQKYRTLVEKSLQGVIIAQDNPIRLSFANQAIADMVGYSVEELVSMSPEKLSCLIHEDDREEFLGNFRKRLAGEQLAPIREYRFIDRSGQVRWIESYSNLIDYNGEKATLTVFVDITDRKKAESELRLNSLVLDQIQDRVTITDLEGRITYVNEAEVRTLGYTKEKLIGSSVEIYGEDPEQGASQSEIVEETLKHGFWRGEVVNYTSDGKEIILDCRTQVVHDENDRVVALCGISTDITKRKQTEEALRDSEFLLNETGDIARVGGWEVDLKTNELKWTKTTRLIHEVDDDFEPNIKNGTEFYEPEYRPIITRVVRDAIAKNKSFDLELQLKTAKGKRIWVRTIGKPEFIDGKCLRVRGIFQDITERKNAELKLRASEEKLASYISLAPDGIFVVDDSGRYIDVNDAALLLTGYSKDELLNMTISDLAHPDFEKNGIESFQELKKNGHVNAEICILTKSGTELWASMDGVRLTDNSFMAFCADITETKRLRELEARAQRLETAGTFAGQIAHDFNNLLGPLIAYPELMRSEIPRNHPVLTYLHDIEMSARRMADINQQLLTLGRRGHYSHDIINLNEVVLQAVREARIDSTTVKCRLELADDLMNIKGGFAQIHRVISNLLSNARDAIGDIGTITIKTENFYADDVSIAFGQVPRGEFIKLTISDDGCGIPEDLVDRVFDPFVTSKKTDRERGSGLGLSIVDAVMKDHEGFVDLETKTGQGTSFYLYFPVSRESRGDESEAEIQGGSEKIMIIDDDRVQRDVTSNLLKKLGYSVSEVDCGEKAIEILKSEHYDLLILDMVMPPGIDGAETYERVIDIQPDQKAIIMSGFSETERVIKAQKLGVGAFIKKPVTLKALASAIRTELNRKRKKAHT